MAFAVDNVRLKELLAVAELNKGMFDDFISFLLSNGYPGLHDFIKTEDSEIAFEIINGYLTRPLPRRVLLYDGIARPYPEAKAKWLFLGWILRDAPEQRLRPMVTSMQGQSLIERQALLLNEVRIYVGRLFTFADAWEWTPIREIFIDRLEGSRRSLKGTIFEAIVRRLLQSIFDEFDVNLTISKGEITLSGETYDVEVIGTNGRILIPVKTRETMGGGHAALFTRDIHKSITVARNQGIDCLPIVIAESWVGDLDSLPSSRAIYIEKNPNQLSEVEPILRKKLTENLGLFLSVC